MGKNGFLERQRERDQKILDAGERLGMQKIWDYIQVALRDPDTMGKDVFGRSRVERLFRKSKELADYFHLAFTTDVEADKRQEELDGLLREIWGEDLSAFYDRYPELKKIRYDRPKKGWVE